MILIHSDLINDDFALFLILAGSTVFALIVGVAFHEACHAFMAQSLGDTLPARQGRTTLNPLAHLDPFGTLMMLFVGFGWGKPVQFNPFGAKVSPKMAAFFVGLAGPLSNFVMAGLLAVPIQAGWVPFINPFWSSRTLLTLNTTEEYIGLFLTGAVYLNCILGVFNLIPIPPLDGFKVALGVLPDPLANEFAKLDRYGIPILMITLFVLPLYFDLNPVRDIMRPTVARLVEYFTGYP